MYKAVPELPRRKTRPGISRRFRILRNAGFKDSDAGYSAGRASGAAFHVPSEEKVLSHEGRCFCQSGGYVVCDAFRADGHHAFKTEGADQGKFTASNVPDAVS